MTRLRAPRIPAQCDRYSSIPAPVSDGHQQRCDTSGTTPANEPGYRTSNCTKARDALIRQSGSVKGQTTAPSRRSWDLRMGDPWSDMRG